MNAINRQWSTTGFIRTTWNMPGTNFSSHGVSTSDYRKSLVSGDVFRVRSLVRQASRVRFEFHQDIIRLPEETLMLTAKIIGTSLNQRGRPFVPELLRALFDEN